MSCIFCQYESKSGERDERTLDDRFGFEAVMDETTLAGGIRDELREGTELQIDGLVVMDRVRVQGDISIRLFT